MVEVMVESEKRSVLFRSVLHSLKTCCSVKCIPCIPVRYVLAVMGFLGMVNVYTLRFDLSMAIVPMVKSSGNSTTNLHYSWTSMEQGWVLSSFFIGYTITQLPGGYLAGRFGARYVFGIGIFMTSVLTLLTPLAAELHIGAIIALRVLEGIFEGVTFPAMHALWGKWAPPKERSILSTITFTGAFSGSVIVFLLSAVLSEYGFAGGWPSVFYVFGIAGIIWFIFWLYLGFSSPATHPRISQSEKKYIETSIAEDTEENMESERIPWLMILSSPAVWAIIIAHFCNNWGLYTLLTCMPSYFKEALNLSMGKDIIQNGVFTTIPYIALAIVILLSGQIADVLRRKCFPTVVVRKLFTTAGFFSAAVGLMAVSYLGSNKLYSVLFFTISVGLSGMAVAGFNINHIDIAPQYAGVLMGITNLVGSIPGVVAPLVAKRIAHEPSPGTNTAKIYQKEWRVVFIIAAAIYVFGAVVYLILGRGERQSWAGAKKETRTENGVNGVNMKLLSEHSED